MSFELRLSPRAQSEITRILSQRGLSTFDRLSLLAAIRAELDNLAHNPHLGTVPKGPFGRPIHRFRVGSKGSSSYLQAAYRFTEDEKALEILDVAEIDPTVL